MTASHLRSAYSGEAMAYLRYRIWARKAEQDGFPHVGRLFRAISHAEEAHATGHFRALANDGGAFLVPAAGGFGLGPTSQNLAGAIEGEEFEVKEMYPVYLSSAKFQGETAAERSLSFAYAAEQIHAALYQNAKEAVDAGKDLDLGPVQICPLCGHTIEGDAPDPCPVCGSGKDLFLEFA